MTVHIEKKGRRIEIRSATPLPGLRTTVPGAYETVSGYWTVPLSLESCKLLRGKFGDRLKIGSELRRWAAGVIQNRRSMAELSAAKDAELEILPTAAPKLYNAMNARKYQRVGARYIADNHASLIADDPGLGKTLIAMGGILEAEVPGPYLVVAPKTASDTVWRREILRWLPPKHRAITLPELRYQRESQLRLTWYDETTWLIVHPEIVMVQAWWECVEPVPEMRLRRKTNKSVTVRKRLEPTGKLIPCGKRTTMGNSQQRELICGHIKTRKTKKIIQPSYPKLFDMEWGAIIVDESHESLIRRTGSPTQRRRGLDMLKSRGDGVRIAMSGTPFDSKPHQLWGTLNWLDPQTYSAFHRWAELYWQKGGYTGFQIGEFRKDREAMLWDSLSAVALRRTKAEVAPDLPPKVHVGTLLDTADETSPVGVWLPMDGKQAHAYEQMEKVSIAELDSGRLEAISALAELTRLKQLACSYGDLEQRTVRVNCYKQPRRYPEPCRECRKGGRKNGYHKELRQFYKPALPSNKFNWIIESLEEWGYPKNPIDKVVVVSFYTGILEMMSAGIEAHFKVKPGNPLCTAITGKTPSKDRREIIDRFNMDDGPQIMMLNVKAGGTAITIDSADRMIFISETRIPDQQKQAEDRIHRVSNPRHCMYYYLRSVGTVDVGTALVNQEMDRETHRLLDQRRGVDYMRHIMSMSH
jgi:SNF2 family DNA or RNA helicase